MAGSSSTDNLGNKNLKSEISRVHADALSLFGRLLEPYGSVDQSKQRVIPTYSDIAAGLHHGAPLAHQDRACAYHRAVAALDPKALALAITAIARATDTFLMRHALVP